MNVFIDYTLYADLFISVSGKMLEIDEVLRKALLTRATQHGSYL